MKTRRATEAARDQALCRGRDNLYRLFLNPNRQFAARGFTLRGEDLDLTLDQGSVFTVDTDQGITALVLLGQGTMRFHPEPAIEKRQIEIFAGSETLESRFDAAYIRVGYLGSHADMSKLAERPVDRRELKRASRFRKSRRSRSRST